MEEARARRAVGIDLIALFAAKCLVGLYVLSTGFSHVSDDDYARVVIAQQFAHHPVLDPSGTSWLPFPFWVAGGAMLVLGRSLAMAQVVAFGIGVVSVAAPYMAMRAVGCGRATALAAVGVALALPWNAWVGVATVPEAMTACLVGAAAIAVTSPRARVIASVGLLAASLSRYEAWPVCATFACACVLGAAARSRSADGAPSHVDRAGSIFAAAIALAGPLGWMAWNAHAHGSAFHFVARVAAYRQAIGAAAIPLWQKLSTFPVALVVASPLVVVVALIGAFALPGDPELRRRWLAPLVSAGAILVFLVYGDVRDGAPTHHPERAVLPILWILAPFGADAVRSLCEGRALARLRDHRRAMAGLALAAGATWLVTLPFRLRPGPGTSAEESRSAQITRGLALARTAGPDAHWTVKPCAYEHFALLAANGEPERFTVLPGPREVVTPECPKVEADGAR